jgi:hypothetical protein
MVCRTAIALAALVVSVLPAKAAENQLESVRLSTLSAGKKLSIRTAEREYRIQLVDPKTGESLVAGSLDGKEFSPPEKMFVVGATRGADANTGGYSLVLMGEIRQGLSIEWGRGSLDSEARGTTSPVRSISVLQN